VVETINYGHDEIGRRTYSERDGIATLGTDGFEYDKNGWLTKFHPNGTLSSTGLVSRWSEHRGAPLLAEGDQL
jgi:hypothetical protein